MGKHLLALSVVRDKAHSTSSKSADFVHMFAIKVFPLLIFRNSVRDKNGASKDGAST